MIEGVAYAWSDEAEEYQSIYGPPQVLKQQQLAGFRWVFNTGRNHTPGGQVIEAKIVAEEICTVLKEPYWRVQFYDRSRCIYGELVLSSVTQKALMAEYDEGRYTELSAPFQTFRDAY